MDKKVRKSTEVLIIRIFKCDKCSHRWIPKKKDIFDRTLTPEEEEKFLKHNFPKKCPKCKSPDWDISGKISDGDFIKDKKSMGLIKKKFGKEIFEYFKAKYDKDFHKKKVLEDIHRVEQDINSHKEYLKCAEDYLKELNEELKNIK